MQEFKCDQCKRKHTRSRRCIYCGAGARHQKPITPPPAPKVRITATQLELPINSPAPSVMTDSQRAGMVNFHERAARAYEASGQAEQAAAARGRAERLKAEAAQEVMTIER